jgi:hypothetical protein
VLNEKGSLIPSKETAFFVALCFSTLD